MLSTILAISCIAGLATAQVVDAKKTSTLTSSTSVPTACSATLAPAKPSGIPCGKTGTLNGYPSYYGGAFGEVNRDACAAVCATIEGCNSFSYNQDLSTCQLYGQTLKQMGFNANNKDRAVAYYGLGCFGCAPVTASATTTSTSTSSTSSSTAVVSTTSTSSSSVVASTTSSTFATSTITGTTTTSSTTADSSSSTIATSTTDGSSSLVTAAPSPACTSPATYVFTVTSTYSNTATSTYTDTYKQYFTGFQVTENSTNPGNSVSTQTRYKTVITQLTDSDDCSAVADCAAVTAGLTSAYFKSFDVYYDASIGSWMCYSFLNKQTDTSYFNVQNVTIGNSYGFST